MSKYLIIIGLITDIVGVTGLYFTKIKTKWEIPYPDFNVSFLWFGVANPEQEAINRLQQDINKVIDSVNSSIEKANRKSLFWFSLILLGFFFQLLSLCCCE